jgi:hypothetical protein
MPTARAEELRRRVEAQQVVMMLRGEHPPVLVNPEIWPRRRSAG